MSDFEISALLLPSGAEGGLCFFCWAIEILVATVLYHRFPELLQSLIFQPLFLADRRLKRLLIRLTEGVDPGFADVDGNGNCELER